MRRKYQTVEMKITKFGFQDVITLSIESIDESKDNQWSFGDMIGGNFQ